jgi:hypothetical protein
MMRAQTEAEKLEKLAANAKADAQATADLKSIADAKIDVD